MTPIIRFIRCYKTKAILIEVNWMQDDRQLVLNFKYRHCHRAQTDVTIQINRFYYSSVINYLSIDSSKEKYIFMNICRNIH